MAALVTHQKTRVTHELRGFLHRPADIPSPSRRGNLVVYVLSLLHSTDLHCQKSLGIALLSQLILSADFEKQKCLNTANVLRMCHHSQPLLQKLVLITPILDISSGVEPDHGEKTYYECAGKHLCYHKENRR